eukprot:CAMPEP_0119415836 /NCGR_PEP_ID=MMETSP1335-20130426/10797_1 /TAXON_ID=259385 /ORGANISM="Chrysoculter rhomboideus, Strain RCC1486" /LENGTH=79 /DNA_ID=CAMNT_0007440891 /DNA_START=334 /DNA_END=569 /DNA_ORIENTATION=+
MPAAAPGAAPTRAAAVHCPFPPRYRALLWARLAFCMPSQRRRRDAAKLLVLPRLMSIGRELPLDDAVASLAHHGGVVVL